MCHGNFGPPKYLVRPDQNFRGKLVRARKKKSVYCPASISERWKVPGELYSKSQEDYQTKAKRFE